MTSLDIFTDGMNTLMPYGRQITVTSFTGSAGSSDYDDEYTYTQVSGTTFTSGILLPIKNKFGSEDAVLMEQGKLLTKDKKLYINGSVDVSGNVLIGLGSPASEYYSIIPDGVKLLNLSNEDVYKKIYIRYHQNGSVY